MREIKFRAWEKNLKQIIPVHNIDFGARMINTDGPWRNFGEIELMQYTGLKDKNGNEIYEGDILSLDGSNIHTCIGYIRDYKGKWVSWYSCDALGRDCFDDLFTVNKDREIIGNIYENPELLESEVSND